MHANQFWCEWPLRFRRYYYFLNLASLSFRTMDYSSSPWGSKNRISSIVLTDEKYYFIACHSPMQLLICAYFSRYEINFEKIPLFLINYFKLHDMLFFSLLHSLFTFFIWLRSQLVQIFTIFHYALS